MSEDKDESATDEELAVPTDLLELHVELEDKEVSPEQFKEAFSE